MLSRFFTSGGLAGLVALLSGCAPLPSTTPVLHQVQGRVVQAESGLPVSGARVTLERAGYRDTVWTSSSGHFKAGPLTQWHFLVYIGSPGVAPVPWYLKHSRADAALTITAPGFAPSQSVFEDRAGILAMSRELQVPQPQEIQLHPAP